MKIRVPGQKQPLEIYRANGRLRAVRIDHLSTASWEEVYTWFGKTDYRLVDVVLPSGDEGAEVDDKRYIETPSGKRIEVTNAAVDRSLGEIEYRDYRMRCGYFDKKDTYPYAEALLDMLIREGYLPDERNTKQRKRGLDFATKRYCADDQDKTLAAVGTMDLPGTDYRLQRCYIGKLGLCYSILNKSNGHSAASLGDGITCGVCISDWACHIWSELWRRKFVLDPTFDSIDSLPPCDVNYDGELRDEIKDFVDTALNGELSERHSARGLYLLPI